MVLPPSTVDELIHKYKLPLTPCLPFLHKKFRGEAKKTLTNRYLIQFLLSRQALHREHELRAGDEVPGGHAAGAAQDRARGDPGLEAGAERQEPRHLDPPRHHRQHLRGGRAQQEVRACVCFILHRLFHRDAMEQEEAQLILDLQNFISKKVVDVEMMANLLIAKDGSSSNQVSSRNIEECFKTVGIELDTALLERVVKLTETRKNHCSIPKIISLIKSGTNPDDDNGAKG